MMVCARSRTFDVGVLGGLGEAGERLVLGHLVTGHHNSHHLADDLAGVQGLAQVRDVLSTGHGHRRMRGEQPAHMLALLTERVRRRRIEIQRT
jgi:hypothetical protein